MSSVSSSRYFSGWRAPAATLLTAMVCALAILVYSAPPTGPGAAPAQKAFSTPDEAAKALIDASKNNDVTALKQILGSDSDDILVSADPVETKNRRLAFAKKAEEKHAVQISPDRPNRAELLIGENDWPFPIPLVKRNGKWFYDTAAGRQQILFRRIGENELDAIQVSRGFVEAQHEYAADKHDGSELNQYAQRIISTPGKHDGLAWKNPDGTWEGPIGDAVANAIEQGYSTKAAPYHGYYFKVLKGQGPAAPMGQMNFVVGGAMIGGFALAAAPAQYRVTGVKTFIVNQDGIVYQKDLGPKTLEIFRSMQSYNPDQTWERTDDEW